MADNKNPDKIQRGEKEPGKYHYNPGHQSGKAVDTKTESEQENNVDWIQDRHPPQGERR